MTLRACMQQMSDPCHTCMPACSLFIPFALFIAVAACAWHLVRRTRRLTRDFGQTWAAQRARAIAVIMVNTDKSISRMHIPPEYNAASIRIPTVMVSSEFEALMPQSAGGQVPFGRFVLLD
jgi:hypothetical protein